MKERTVLNNALRCLTFAILAQFSLFLQMASATARSTKTAVRIPFVGCKSDGQVGPLKAPHGQSQMAHIPEVIARRLAYYQAANGFGVLAPRGWYCFGTYGSSGNNLYVSPTPIKTADLFSTTWRGFTGTVIQVSEEYGDTSGRFGVAQTIARVFPAYRVFVKKVIAEGIEPASSFPSGPYPKDKLNYRGSGIVEFTTPADTEGLGTHSWLLKNGDPIRGVVILCGQSPDALQLSMRLDAETKSLATLIIGQIEDDAAPVRR